MKTSRRPSGGLAQNQIALPMLAALLKPSVVGAVDARGCNSTFPSHEKSLAASLSSRLASRGATYPAKAFLNTDRRPVLCPHAPLGSAHPHHEFFTGAVEQGTRFETAAKLGPRLLSTVRIRPVDIVVLATYPIAPDAMIIGRLM